MNVKIRVELRQELGIVMKISGKCYNLLTRRCVRSMEDSFTSCEWDEADALHQAQHELRQCLQLLVDHKEIRAAPFHAPISSPLQHEYDALSSHSPNHRRKEAQMTSE